MAGQGISAADFNRARENLDFLDLVTRGAADATVTIPTAGGDVEIRTLLNLIAWIESEGDAALASILDQGFLGPRYDTEAALTADLTPAAGETSVALDTMRVFRKTGASGTGSWTLVSDVLNQFAGTATSASVDAAANRAAMGLRYPPGRLAAASMTSLTFGANLNAAENPEPGSVLVRAGVIHHPDPAIGRVQMGNLTVRTPYEGVVDPPEGVAWIMWSQSEVQARFNNDANIQPGQFVAVDYDPAARQFRARGNGSNVHPFTPVASDLAVAVIYSGIGATQIDGVLPLGSGVSNIEARLLQLESQTGVAGDGGVVAQPVTWNGILPAATVEVGELWPARLLRFGAGNDPDFGFSLPPGAEWADVEWQLRRTPNLALSGEGDANGEVFVVGDSPTTTVAVHKVQLGARLPGTEWRYTQVANYEVVDPAELWAWTGALPVQTMQLGREITPIDLLALGSGDPSPEFTLVSSVPGIALTGTTLTGTPALLGTHTIVVRERRGAQISRAYTVSPGSQIPLSAVSLTDLDALA